MNDSYVQSEMRVRYGARYDQARYPNKIFSLSEHYLPRTVKELFWFCKYYYQTNPALSQAITMSAEYPITDIVIQTDNEELRKRYENLLKQWNIREQMIDIGINYFVFGNAFASLIFTQHRYAVCTRCGRRVRIKAKLAEKETRWMNFKVVGPCRGCFSHSIEHKIEDIYSMAPEFMHLAHWSPNDIEIEHNQITGQNTYYYCIPPDMRSKIYRGDPDTLETTPMLFIEALRRGGNHRVRINRDNIFHFARAGMSTEYRGWGVPIPMAALQDLYYRGILRRAQEAIALDHIVPLRFFYPESEAGGPPPSQSYNIEEWRQELTEDIKRWRRDPNHIIFAPVPIGVGYFGGQARSLMVGPEIQQADQNIIVASQMFQEAIYGGVSWSGSSVSLRMLENRYMTYRDRLEEFLQFILDTAATVLRWEKVTVRLAEFKMADDQMRRDFLLKLNMALKVSDKTLFAELGIDPEGEAEQIRKELKEHGDLQMVQARVQALAQMEAQAIMQRQAQMAMAQDPSMAMMQGGGQGQPGQPGQPAQPGQPGQSGGTTPVAGAPAGGAQGGMSPNGMPGAMPGAPGSGTTGQWTGSFPVDPSMIANMYAQTIMRMDPESQAFVLSNVYQQSPHFYQVLENIMSQFNAAMGGGGGGGQKPLPEQRPPQRAQSSV